MKLSVVVPVYNVEKYLPRCLDSLLRQGLEVGEYEVICVNDGSPDNSAEILAEYEKKHPDIIKVIKQENKGLGEARNTGMRVAQGEYIAFVDSDDYIIDQGFGYLCSHFLNKKPDIVSYWSVTLTPYQLKHYMYSDKPDGEVYFEGDGIDAYNKYSIFFSTDKLYKRSFLAEHGVWFDQVCISEDIRFNFQLFRYNPYMMMTSCNIYRYTKENTNSILLQKSPASLIPKIEGMLSNIEFFNQYLTGEDLSLAPGVKRILQAQVRVFYTRTFSVSLSHKQWKNYMTQLRSYPYHQVKMDGKWFIVGKMMNGACSSYFIYNMMRICYQKVFERHIRKRLY